MNEKYAFIYKIKEDQTICLYRVFSNTSHITIPDTIDGHSVTELASYCFSTKKYKEQDLLHSTSLDGLYEIALDQVESITLNNSLKKLGSFVFYNCRKLQSVSFGTNCMEIGSDIFINCHKLQDIFFRLDMNQPTILKQILTQISWDVDIHFNDHSLFYSEYYEIYDEIGPAHIFGLNISGEGFRLRQCFKDGVVNYPEYIHTFDKLCVEESVKSLAHFVMYQYAYEPRYYQSFLQEHEAFFAQYILETKKISDKEKLELYKVLIQNDNLSKETISSLIDQASQSQPIEMITHLIDLKKQYFSSSTTYDFEDF